MTEPRFSIALACFRTSSVYLTMLAVLMGVRCNTLYPERDAYTELKSSLLSHPYAVNKIPPKVGQNDSIDIHISFVPNEILFVNEGEMTVTVAATIYIQWEEPVFSWNPAENGSIGSISVASSDIWTPILVNTRTIDTEDIYIQMPPILRVDFSGMIRSVQIVTLTASCSFDMEWYPFDDQICYFDFYPFNGENAIINTLYAPNLMADIIEAKDKSEWTCEEVTHTQIESAIELEGVQLKSFEFTRFKVLMKRRSAFFYSTNMIFPVAASGALVLGVFLIPPSSGEKISYLISIFISMTVFLSSITSEMSKGEGTICRFNAVIVTISVKIILATMASIFVIRRYTQEQEEKEQEMTSSSSARGEGDNSCFSFDSLPIKLKRFIKESKKDPLEIRNSVSESIQLGATKIDAFERAGSTSAEPRTTNAASCPKAQVSGKSRCWTKGRRLTSAELDRMFFLLFSICSVIIYPVLMHGK
ncbi:neuronal acetylcholine receptor subunit alpha-2 [Plakobranchus ocellatus]|uniref:Neuronal acetylcholine receptor subunit alpha-2 n=1 Tax=Plakobranchus ocellatus TaxID=259542 RepID=A0AAV4BX79_9GAST|nr:neuronal acetylcholine receptor subunit alpha-2 [Plakobranchus ocellatus]